MMLLKKTTILLGIIFAGTAECHAGDPITGKITFSARPPLVALIYVPGETPETPAPEIDQVDKQFTKKMVVASPQSRVVFKNSDAVDHNIFANDATHNARFDVGLMESGGQKAVAIDWDKDAIVRIGCKIHPRMRSYIATVNASYQKIVEFDKQKTEYLIDLRDIPEDAEKIIMRIPKYEPIELDIRTGSSWTSPIMKKGRQRGEVILTRGAQ